MISDLLQSNGNIWRVSSDNDAPAFTRDRQMPGESTRYACATAHLDPDFAKRVWKRFTEPDRRAHAPELNLDVEAVLYNCLDSIRRKKRCNRFVVTFIVLAAMFYLCTAISSKFLILTDVFLCVAVAAIVQDSWVRHYRLASKFAEPGRPATKPHLTPTVRERQLIEAAIDQQKTNVVVYAGFNPFVGFGVDLGGWSFAVNLKKGKRTIDGQTLVPDTFAESDVYKAIEAALTPFNDNSNLSTSRILCINGKDVRRDGRFLIHPLLPPRRTASADEICDAIGSPVNQIRYYTCFQLTSWSGDLIVSLFFRARVVNNNAFFEVNYRLLPPIAHKFRACDAIKSPKLNVKKAVAFVSSAIAAVVLLAVEMGCKAIFELLKVVTSPSSIFDRAREERVRCEEIIESRDYNYGSSGSLREELATRSATEAGVYHRYFQKLDREMYSKILERQLLDALIVFLSERNVDTHDLESRQDTILNNGVILSGASQLNASVVSVGDRAKAVLNTVRDAVAVSK